MVDQPEGVARHRLPVSLILLVSMTAAGVVYPVTGAALHHTSPVMIAALRALVGGALLTAVLPLMGAGCRERDGCGCGRSGSGSVTPHSRRSASVSGPSELVRP